jgi:hypothetical protein
MSDSADDQMEQVTGPYETPSWRMEHTCDIDRVAHAEQLRTAHVA